MHRPFIACAGQRNEDNRYLFAHFKNGYDRAESEIYSVIQKSYNQRVVTAEEITPEKGISFPEPAFALSNRSGTNHTGN